MATHHVHVILRRDVDKLGTAGELVRVRPGFARNYLLPRSLAVVATDENKRHVEHERKLALASAAKQKGHAEGLAPCGWDEEAVQVSYVYAAPGTQADGGLDYPWCAMPADGGSDAGDSGTD